MANFSATFIAWGAFTRQLLGLVLYSDYISETDDAVELLATTTQDTDPTNYYKLTGMIRNYTNVVLNGAAAITSLMASLGIGGSINLMVWTWGNMLGFLVHLVNQIVPRVGYNTTYGQLTDDANSAE